MSTPPERLILVTFTISKFKVVVAIVATALLIPSTAMAFHVFDDVADDKFYADPVEWAFNNGITTGKTASTFAPDDGVTRGEAVTFLKRYNDNVVEPAVMANETAAAAAQAAADAAQADADENTSDIDDLPTTLFATIEPGGDEYTGSFGLESSVRDSTGNYTLTFDRDVSECAATTADMFFLTTRDVSAEPGSPDDNQVRLRITNASGVAEDTWFSIVVVCAPPDELVIIALDADSPSVAAVGPQD